MARYHIYKLGLAIVFYMIYLKPKLLVSGLKDDEIAPTLRTTDYRERRDAGDFKGDGTPNVDFPTYSHVPKTKFSCKDMEPGYYADIETDCQVFHICDEGRKLSFLCPNGTVFQQGELICDWWFKVNCTTAPLLYEESAEILQRENARRKSHRRIYQDSKYGSFSSQEHYTSKQVPSTTESFPRTYTSRGDRRQDSITYDPNSNKIDEPRQQNYLQSTSKFQPNQNRLEELGIIIKANNNLPLSTNRPINSKSRISSYGNSIKDYSVETQEVQETASFVTNSRNHLPTYTKTYPNHRETYSDIQDPRRYYQQHTKLPVKPFYGSSVSPQVLSTVPVSSNFGNFLLTTEPSHPTFESRFSFNFKTTSPAKKRIENIRTLYTTIVPTTTVIVNTNGRTTTENINVSTIKLDSRVLQSDDVSEKSVDATTTEEPISTTTTMTTTTKSVTTNKPIETTITKIQTIPYPTTTEIPTTTVYSTPVTTTIPRFFPSTILQPKPFSINPNTVLPTQSSSLNPFVINVNPPDPLELSFPIPTQPTPFNLPTTTITSVEENVNNMIETLMNVVSRKKNTERNFTASSPELLSPPSVGPQTLHTLAIYFANALENMSSNGSEESTTTSSGLNNEEVIKDLLTQMTRNNYDNLFKQTTEASTKPVLDDVDVANDLVKEDSHNLVSDVPNVRVLARVFTEALSAYLEDPETFKKVLHEVRPTEPPSLQNETTETDDDEVLNYSDSDLKADLPYLHTPTTDSSISPTWGYILALNTTTPTDLSKNLLSPETEKLQSADSQSFVSQFNKIMKEMKATATPEEANALSTLPKNHWTMSKDVEKLWQNALSINPLTFNENFDTPNVDASIGSEDNSDESLVSEVHYDLRSLPKIELNSTQVHGILIDFMQSNKTQGAEKLQRLLNKLNITENQFLNRMKEVEKNPFTRRLILLLINECSNSSSKEEVEPRALSAIDDLEEKESATHSQSEDSLFKNIDPTLKEEDEDTRALRLLNSLYVIASKFGK